MNRWHDGLRLYRRQISPQPRNLLFILCADDGRGAALAAACNPAMVLQGDDSTDAWLTPMVEKAIRSGVRRVVVCGHDRRGEGRAAAARAVAERCARLKNHPGLRDLLRGVEVIGLWFDHDEGDIHACDPEGRTRLLGDLDFASLLHLTDDVPLSMSPAVTGGSRQGRLEIVLGDPKRSEPA